MNITKDISISCTYVVSYVQINNYEYPMNISISYITNISNETITRIRWRAHHDGELTPQDHQVAGVMAAI